MNYRFDKLGMINEGIFITELARREGFFSLDEPFFAGKEVWARQNKKERKEKRKEKKKLLDYELLKLYGTNTEE